MPYLVYFGAIWSPVCITTTQILEELDKKFSGKINMGKVNVDNEIKTTNEYDIQNIPTIIFFVKGEVKEKIVGSVSKELLERKISKYITMGRKLKKVEQKREK